GYNQINPAINQVVKATPFQLDYLQPLLARVVPTMSAPIRTLNIFYPLIVLDGSMWEYRLENENQPNLQEVSYVKYQASSLSESQTSRAQEAAPPRQFLIDVVRKEFLSDYIGWLEEEIEIITNMPPPS